MTTILSKFFLLVLLTIALLFNHTANAGNKTANKILVLGDSLSSAYGIDTNEGWVALLQHQINEKGLAYTMVNASVSGDTTRTGLNRLSSALKAHTPTIVIVGLGGNDGLRGLPFSEMESSLSKIISLCQRNNAKVLLAGVRLPPNYGPAYNKRFAEVYQKLSTRYDVPLVPQILANVAERRELIQADGIHPKAAAQPQIAENIWMGLEPILH